MSDQELNHQEKNAKNQKIPDDKSIKSRQEYLNGSKTQSSIKDDEENVPSLKNRDHQVSESNPSNSVSQLNDKKYVEFARSVILATKKPNDIYRVPKRPLSLTRNWDGSRCSSAISGRNNYSALQFSDRRPSSVATENGSDISPPMIWNVDPNAKMIANAPRRQSSFHFSNDDQKQNIFSCKESDECGAQIPVTDVAYSHFNQSEDFNICNAANLKRNKKLFYWPGFQIEKKLQEEAEIIELFGNAELTLPPLDANDYQFFVDVCSETDLNALFPQFTCPCKGDPAYHFNSK